eukprot:363413-Chlamydomonas_euryale.AAC.2
MSRPSLALMLLPRLHARCCCGCGHPVHDSSSRALTGSCRTVVRCVGQPLVLLFGRAVDSS